ncbi:MAG: hypothetical protein ACON4N_07080 [Myxococcota bacterium]
MRYVFATLWAAAACTPTTSESQRCNLYEALCDRPVAEVTFAGTHNSMSSAEEDWFAPNQTFGITQQLEDGIRALMLDTYEQNGELLLCHGMCVLGSKPLSAGLQEIAGFLDSHPDEVIQIIFQDAIAREATRDALTEVGLASRLHVWTPGSRVTLRELIASRENLIVGLESGQSDEEGLHAAWSLWTDTPYSYSDPDQFSCERLRGEDDNDLFLMNHWLGTPLPSPQNGAVANAGSLLLDRAEDCIDLRGRPINTLAVDFYDQGDLLDVVNHLNGVGDEQP